MSEEIYRRSQGAAIDASYAAQLREESLIEEREKELELDVKIEEIFSNIGPEDGRKWIDIAKKSVKEALEKGDINIERLSDEERVAIAAEAKAEEIFSDIAGPGNSEDWVTKTKIKVKDALKKGNMDIETFSYELVSDLEDARRRRKAEIAKQGNMTDANMAEMNIKNSNKLREVRGQIRQMAKPQNVVNAKKEVQDVKSVEKLSVTQKFLRKLFS